MFYIAVAVYFTLQSLRFTMWGHIGIVAARPLFTFLNMACMALLAVKALTDEHAKREWAIGIVLLAVLLVCGHTSTDYRPFQLALFVIAAKDIDFLKLAKWVAVPVLAIVVISIVLAEAGVIENIEAWRNNILGFKRLSMGFTNPNTLGFVTLLGTSLLAVICWGRHRIVHLVVSVIALIFTFLIADSRGASIAIVLVAALVVMSGAKPARRNGFGGNRSVIVCFSLFLLCAFISYAWTIFYNPLGSSVQWIDDLLSYRLTFAHGFYILYPPQLLGFDISQIPNQLVAPTFETAFVVDNGFARLLLANGIVVTVVMMASIAAMYIKAIRERTCNAVLILMTLMVVYGTMEQYGLLLYINIFFIALATLFHNKPLASLSIPIERGDMPQTGALETGDGKEDPRSKASASTAKASKGAPRRKNVKNGRDRSSARPRVSAARGVQKKPGANRGRQGYQGSSRYGSGRTGRAQEGR